jgi:flagellar motor switch protein FliM
VSKTAAKKNSAASTAPAGSASARRYDFRLPRKLNQSQRIKLGAVYSRLAGRLAERFRSLLRCQAEATFVGLEQVQAGSWQPSDDADAVVCVMPLQPGPGNIYVSWSRNLAFFIIERLLGGSGEDLFIDKELSDFENRIVMKTTNWITQELQSAWNHPSFAEAKCRELLENRQAFVETCGPEILLIASWGLHLDQLRGKLGIYFPYSVVKSWLETADPAGQENAAAPPPNRMGVAPALAGATVTLAVRLNPNPIRLDDFIHLQAGDCLQLEHLTQHPVGVYVNQRLKFRGHLGVQGRRLAVKITSLAAE